MGMMRLPFESEPAKRLNEDVFETIYFAACEASCDLAAHEGTYESYAGSPASKGLLQFDLWNRKPKSGRWDWTGLKGKIAKHGLRNSLMVAPMPTASTAQILGNNESFEPYTQNLYVRRTLSGEFVQVNRHLLQDLIKRGLWTDDMRTQLMAHNGSVQQLGLKTGMYYLRTKAAADAIKFTVEVDKVRKASVAGQEIATKGGGASNAAEQKAMERLKAGEPEHQCLNCSA